MPSKQARLNSLVRDIIDTIEDDMDYYLGHSREDVEFALEKLLKELEVRV